MQTFHGSFTEEKEVLFIHPDTGESWHIPLSRENPVIHVSHISSYPPKEVLGDWTRASHEVLSSYTQSEFTGGGQVRYADEATDQSRFWRGTLGSRHPFQLCLPLMSRWHSRDIDETCTPLGDYGQNFYAAFGLDLAKVTTATETVVATLSHAPMAKTALAFSPKDGTKPSRLFIPMGSNGYQIWDGVTLSAVMTGVRPIDFCEWDHKIYALQADGKLFEALIGETDWIEKVSIPAEAEARCLIEFYNRQDENTLHIVSRSALYGLDLSIGKAYRTELDPPPHADAGLAAAKWRADLYVSYGIGVHQYTGNSIIATGLDRNAGLPKELKGAIVSMASGYNGIYALCRGRQEVEASPDILTTDLSHHDIYMSSLASQTSLWMWDSFGWAQCWESDGVGETPTNVLISTQTGVERLWWGIGNRLYFQDVHHMYYNPEQRDEDALYELDGYLEMSTMDFAMAGQLKCLYALEVMAKNLTDTETIQLSYKIDDGDWVAMEPVSRRGKRGIRRFFMGSKGFHQDNKTYRFDGIPFNDITIRIEMKRGSDPTKTPLLGSIGIVYHKLMGDLFAYSFVTATDEENFRDYKGHSLVEINRFLHEMVSSKVLVPMLHQGEWRSVRFAGANGDDEVGMEFTGPRSVSVLEVLEEIEE